MVKTIQFYMITLYYRVRFKLDFIIYSITMGNDLSTIDHIAVDHILSSSVHDLHALRNPEYCNIIMRQYKPGLALMSFPVEFKGMMCDASHIIRFYIRVGQLYGILLETLKPVNKHGDPCTLSDRAYFHNPCLEVLKDLSGELGCLPDIRDLFYDIYDPYSKEYNQMSEESRKEYQEMIDLFREYIGISTPASSFKDIRLPPLPLDHTWSHKPHQDPIESYAYECIHLQQEGMKYNQQLMEVYHRLFIKDHLHPEITVYIVEELFKEVKALLQEKQQKCSIGISNIMKRFNVVLEKQTLRLIQKKLKYLETQNFFSNINI